LLSPALLPRFSSATPFQHRFWFASLYHPIPVSPSQSLYPFPQSDWELSHIYLCILLPLNRADRFDLGSLLFQDFDARSSQDSLPARETIAVRFRNAWRWDHLSFFTFSVRFQFSDAARHRRGALYVSNV
jgi:hypothetical protein